MWESLQQTPPFILVERHDVLFAWLAFASVLMFIGSLVLVPLLLTWMPADYLTRDREDSWAARTALGWVAVIAKNIAGVVLLAAGIAMLVLPGQGIISILAGLSLMNFPGKRRLERKIISRPGVLRSINWLRAKAGREGLRLE